MSDKTFKISRYYLYEVINNILNHSRSKKRNFIETVELQIGLKNYDPKKDKRFSGKVMLKHIPRPRLRVCLIGDESHCDEAKDNGIPYMDINALKKLNKDKKLVKRMWKKYDVFVASDTLIKSIPRLLGPSLGKAGKFPSVITHEEELVEKVSDIKRTIKFQMKKTVSLAVPVGHVHMSEDELAQNIYLAVNFLVSLLKKKWQNVGSFFVKSTMGPALKLY